MLVGMESAKVCDLPAEACSMLPSRISKRKRISVLSGSSIRLEALPPAEGAHLLPTKQKLLLKARLLASCSSERYISSSSKVLEMLLLLCFG